MIQQIPPTPTPIPPGSSGYNLDLSGSIPSLWDSAPEAVGLWHTITQGNGQVVQWIFVAALSIFLIWIFARLVSRLSNEDA